MATKDSLLALLEERRGEFVSGQTIGELLGVSRNAIWKACAQLKKEGHRIESRTNSGYRLLVSSDVLDAEEIMAGVKVPCEIEIADTVTSTNDVMKSRSVPDDRPLVLIAKEQSGGKGRLGRSFASPPGTGLYFTMGIKPKFDISKSLFVTMGAAVAVCRAIKTVCGKDAEIKWVNDIFLDGKKICGILTEAQTNFELGIIDTLIIGIGINCFPEKYPEEVAGVAGSIADEEGAFSRNDLAVALINELMRIMDEVETRSFFKEYKERCFILGSAVRVKKNYNDEGILADAIDITDDGALVVRYLEGEDRGMRAELRTGEVSIRPVI